MKKANHALERRWVLILTSQNKGFLRTLMVLTHLKEWMKKGLETPQPITNS